MRKLRRRGTGISAKRCATPLAQVCRTDGITVPSRWHKRFRRVARLFPAYGTVVLSGRQGSYQCLLVSLTMHDMMIHNACYGHYQCHDVSLIVDLFQVPFVHFPYPFLNFNLVVPSQGVEFGRIGQFAQGTVRFAAVEG